MLAAYSEKLRRYPNLRIGAPTRDAINRICECAVRLVHLGADCQVKLQIPAQRRNAPVNLAEDAVTAFRSLNFDGKTGRELAGISCSEN